ncbi:MAG: glycosyltransferase family 2 protein [Pseudomonadota bacterium]
MSRVEPYFSVIIVNYNAGDLLQDAINSLKNQSFKDFEVLVIDNNSESKPIGELDLTGLDRVRVMRENTNHGFAKGNNLAANLATGKWLALLNPDAVADQHWLEEVHKATERHASCRVFACGQINMDEPDLLDGAGDAYFAFGIPWRGGFEHPRSALPSEDSHCFSPCGASAIYDRELFLSIGGYDERFFCYCEDVDLGIRLQLSGEQCVLLPDALIYHKGSATSGRHSYFTMYHGFRNRTWAYIKNMPLAFLILTLPGHVSLMAYNYINNIGHGNLRAMRRGMWDGLRDGWAMRRQNRFKTGTKNRSTWNLIRSMAWNPVRLSQRGVHVWAVPA